jgi:hypothetical protein
MNSDRTERLTREVVGSDEIPTLAGEWVHVVATAALILVAALALAETVL